MAIHRVSNIPFNKDEVVKRVEVSRKVNKRVLTKSTQVVVPIVPSTLSNPHPLLPLPSDHDTPPIPTKTRKGPSRSVSVSLSPPLFYLC